MTLKTTAPSLFAVLCCALASINSRADEATTPTPAPIASPSDQTAYVGEIKKLLEELEKANLRYKWNNAIFEMHGGWKFKTKSVGGRPLIYFECGDNPKNTSLILSSVHGDEITPIYWGFRMVYFLIKEPEQCAHKKIIVAPFVNPDGFLKPKPTRTNANGVDVNRNFPTKDFVASALKLWKERFNKDVRRFPGEEPGSEPETQFQIDLIKEFNPQKILSIHAPLNFLDYDGPDKNDGSFSKAYVDTTGKLLDNVKKAIKSYKFHPWGIFPGSLGNYAGRERGIPTFTLELPTIDQNKAKKYFDELKPGVLAFLQN